MPELVHFFLPQQSG